MKYKINVTVYNNEPYEGMNKEVSLKLEAYFHYDETQYGNGHYLSIIGKNFNDQYIDIRYDHSFNRNNKIEYLTKWVHGYWSGRNGGYKVKSLSITEG